MGHLFIVEGAMRNPWKRSLRRMLMEGEADICWDYSDGENPQLYLLLRIPQTHEERCAFLRQLPGWVEHRVIQAIVFSDLARITHVSVCGSLVIGETWLTNGMSQQSAHVVELPLDDIHPLNADVTTIAHDEAA